MFCVESTCVFIKKSRSGRVGPGVAWGWGGERRKLGFCACASMLFLLKATGSLSLRGGCTAWGAALGVSLWCLSSNGVLHPGPHFGAVGATLALNHIHKKLWGRGGLNFLVFLIFLGWWVGEVVGG